MSIKPILFNTEMVRAILDGSKTVTRRATKSIPVETHRIEPIQTFDGGNLKFECHYGGYMPDVPGFTDGATTVNPPYQPGDILYVRETWCALPVNEAGHMRGHDIYYYRADGDLRPVSWRGEWRPSIHMPKEAARIFLRVTDVRVERLQDIDGMGILAEGIDNGKSNPAMGIRWENMQRMAFETLWNSTLKKSELVRYGWDENPWVWVIEFERCKKTEDIV